MRLIVRGRKRPAGATLAVLAAVAAGTTACAGPAAQGQQVPPRLAVRTHAPASAASVTAGSPDVVAASVARQLFAAAPVVVVARTDRPAALVTAAASAGRAHAPLLLTSSRPGGQALGPAVRAEIRSLHPAAVLAVGIRAKALSAQLAGIRVISDPARLPLTVAPAPLGQVAVLTRGTGAGAGPAAVAAAATATAAGAHVVAVGGYDPRAYPAAITALAAARPRQVIAVGARFGPARLLAARVAVAATGVQLPGGGQLLFPRRRLVALYGHPGAPSLGVLGQQDLSASITRARRAATLYRGLSGVPVVPAFEIIASVAQGSPGPDGSYSATSPLALLRPWVQQATRARMYVVLDLQPGRASLLAQAKRYQALLERPNVGLALDAEWKLQPGQRPLQQIGSVSIGEVNSVASWLARLTARYHLPQKLLVLHQFRLSMISDEARLDTRHDDLSIVIHMDGQGTAPNKEQTWNAVTHAAPRGVHFGWKDFYRQDHPMLGPRQTLDRNPRPVMISYQ